MKIWHRGKLIDSSKREQSLSRKLEKVVNCEQYSLRAIRSGWFPCTHCRNKRYWLNADEIARYGMTCDVEARYTKEELIEKDVYYFTEFKGNLQECIVKEAEKIFQYYKHPDNLKRYEGNRISLPPLNLRDD